MELSKKILVNICRILLGLTFIASGFVKAIDPLGTQYKIIDYLTALGVYDVLSQGLMDNILLGVSVLLSMAEFSMGVFILLAMGRRMMSKMALVFMAVMTIVTVWIYIADPVKDCGCFGDALILTNGETLAKNIVLLVAAAVITWRPLYMVRMLSKSNQWIVFHYCIIFSVLTSVWCLYDLPVFDFRPYHVGTNIQEAMTIPDDAEQPEYDTTFILEKDGVRKEFTLDDYPDSTWTFIDSKTTLVKEGYVPPIHDFDITRVDDGEDITDDVLTYKGYTFLLVAPYLEKADDSNFGPIDQLYEYAEDNGYRFFCLTSSDEKGIRHWSDITGAEYPFCNTDGTTLKTIIRSNPGLVLLKDGVIVGKWSHNRLPTGNELNVPLEKASWAHMTNVTDAYRLMRLMLMFFVPLILLVVADRLWTWSRWIKDKEHKLKEEVTKSRDVSKGA